MTLQTIYEEVSEWSQRNFLDGASWEPLVGMGEEIGELEEAIEVKGKSVHKCDVGPVLDAIGDITIYLFDFIRRLDIPDERKQVWSGSGIEVTLESLKSHYAHHSKTFRDSPNWHKGPLLKSYGKVCHSFLKRHQGIRLKEDHIGRILVYSHFIIEDLFYLATFYSDFKGGLHMGAFEAAVQETWDHVKERDWNKHREEHTQNIQKG